MNGEELKERNKNDRKVFENEFSIDKIIENLKSNLIEEVKIKSIRQDKLGNNIQNDYGLCEIEIQKSYSILMAKSDITKYYLGARYIIADNNLYPTDGDIEFSVCENQVLDFSHFYLTA